MESAPEVLKRLVPALGDAAFAYAFGSVVTGRSGPESDVDLAADFGRKLGTAELLERRERLAAIAGRDVDLIDLRDADPIIAMQVLRTGRVLLVRDGHALTVFQMTTPSRYFDWKICRRPVEKALWAAAGRT